MPMSRIHRYRMLPQLPNCNVTKSYWLTGANWARLFPALGSVAYVGSLKLAMSISTMDECKRYKSGFPLLPLLSGLTTAQHWNYPISHLKQQLCIMSHTSVDWLGSSGQCATYGKALVSHGCIQPGKLSERWYYIRCWIIVRCEGCPVHYRILAASLASRY